MLLFSPSIESKSFQNQSEMRRLPSRFVIFGWRNPNWTCFSKKENCRSTITPHGSQSQPCLLVLRLRPCNELLTQQFYPFSIWTECSKFHAVSSDPCRWRARRVREFSNYRWWQSLVEVCAFDRLKVGQQKSVTCATCEILQVYELFAPLVFQLTWISKRTSDFHRQSSFQSKCYFRDKTKPYQLSRHQKTSRFQKPLQSLKSVWAPEWAYWLLLSFLRHCDQAAQESSPWTE